MEIFVSYSHRDTEWHDRVQVFLEILKQKYSDGDFLSWSDIRIKVGTRWEDEINDAIQRSNLALLLISPDFLASDFIMRNELSAIEAQEVSFYGVLVRPCPWVLFDRLRSIQLANVSQPLSALKPHAVDRLLSDLVYDLDARIQAFAATDEPEEEEEALANTLVAQQSPTEKAARTSTPEPAQFDPDGYRFLTSRDVEEVIQDELQQRVVDILKIFKVRRQQTWLAVTDRLIVCVLDSRRTAEGKRLIQWDIPIRHDMAVDVRDRRKSGSGRSALLDIGPKRNWLLSLPLFARDGRDPKEVAQEDVRALIHKAAPAVT